MDPRTGLGRFRDFRISNYQLMMQLIDACTTMCVERDPRARPTSPSASSSTAPTRSARRPRSAAAPRVHGKLVVLDLRDEEVIHPTNRFTIYALFPQCNISIHVLWGLRQQNTVFATGKSILDRSSRDERRRADARATAAAATTRPAPARSTTSGAEAVLAELVGRIGAEG